MFPYLWTNQTDCIMIQSMAGYLASQIAAEQRKPHIFKEKKYIFFQYDYLLFSEMLCIIKSTECPYQQTRWKVHKGRVQDNLEANPRENLWWSSCQINKYFLFPTLSWLFMFLTKNIWLTDCSLVIRQSCRSH